MSVLSMVAVRIRKSVNGSLGFLRNSVLELKKVRWPSKQEMVSYTLVVLSTVLVLSVFFFLVDFGIYKLVTLITR